MAFFRRYFFEQLAHFATAAHEREKLEEFVRTNDGLCTRRKAQPRERACTRACACTHARARARACACAAGREELDEYCTREKRTYCEVIKLWPYVVMAYIVMALYSYGVCSYGVYSYGPIPVWPI